MSDILEDLDPAQREAAEHVDGPLLITASPGSGKTRVLVHRTAHLVADIGIDPETILMTTFTRKAAQEMRGRLVGLIGDRAARVTLGTVHSRCLDVLRHGDGLEEVGLRPGFTHIKEDAAGRLISRLVRDLVEDDLGEDPRNKFVLQRLGLADMAARIGYAKEWNLGPQAAGKEFGWTPQAVTIYEAYEEDLKRTNRVDFPGMQKYAVELLERRPATLAWMQGRFQYVIIDEYQDTNAVQARFFDLLARVHRNIAVVGDVDQTVFEWRAATPQYMLDFEKAWPGAKTVRLARNYRSGAAIVDHAAQLIRRNVKRFDFVPDPVKPAGDQPAVVLLDNAFDEADFIVREIARRHGGGDPWKEIAVLYRTNSQSRAIESAFLRNRIPYVVKKLKFFERQEVQDVLAWAALLVNPSDEDAFRRVTQAPPCGVGVKTVELLAKEAKGSARPIFDVALDPPPEVRGKTRGYVILLASAVNGLREKQGDPAFLEEVVHRTNYRDHLAKQEEPTERSKNVDLLLELYREFAPPGESSKIRAFLDYVSAELLLDVDKEETDAVLLSTMHGSKGTEFDVVLVAGCSEGITPSLRSGPEGLEEERRLFYVAMTRARKRLVLYSPRRPAWPVDRGMPPSRFLYEAGLLDRNADGADGDDRPAPVSLAGWRSR